MASTRNHNQAYDYACKKKQIQKHASHRFEPLFHEPKHAYQSFVLGANPTKLNANTLSYNAVDVESTLRGIRSCNLEGSSFQASLQPKDYYTVELFDSHLQNNVYVPRPFYHDSDQRVGFHNL